jgi:hypothetical protein
MAPIIGQFTIIHIQEKFNVIYLTLDVTNLKIRMLLNYSQKYHIKMYNYIFHVTFILISA